MSAFREQKTILFGETTIKADQDVFMLARIKKGNPGYILVSNFGNVEHSVSVNSTEINHIAERGTLTLGVPPSEDMPDKSTILFDQMKMPPHTSYLITFVPK